MLLAIKPDIKKMYCIIVVILGYIINFRDNLRIDTQVKLITVFVVSKIYSIKRDKDFLTIHKKDLTVNIFHKYEYLCLRQQEMFLYFVIC